MTILLIYLHFIWFILSYLASILCYFFIISYTDAKSEKQKHPMSLLIRRLKVTSLVSFKTDSNPLRYLFIFSLKQVQRFPTDLNRGNKRDHVLQDVINTDFRRPLAFFPFPVVWCCLCLRQDIPYFYDYLFPLDFFLICFLL